MRPNAYHSAIAMLARREHGAVELTQKLAKKGYTVAEIETTLKTCQQLGLQDDMRFAEQKTRIRMAQGYGPERIRLELKHLSISSEMIEKVVMDETLDWLTQAQAVLQKKYGGIGGDSISARQKQKQFLYYRGFSPHLIGQVLAGRVNE